MVYSQYSKAFFGLSAWDLEQAARKTWAVRYLNRFLVARVESDFDCPPWEDGDFCAAPSKKALRQNEIRWIDGDCYVEKDGVVYQMGGLVGDITRFASKSWQSRRARQLASESEGMIRAWENEGALSWSIQPARVVEDRLFFEGGFLAGCGGYYLPDLGGKAAAKELAYIKSEIADAGKFLDRAVWLDAPRWDDAAKDFFGSFDCITIVR